MKNITTEVKVGVFAVAIVIILAWATVRVSDKTTVHGGGYKLKVVFDNATGLKLKSPVELAGVQVGVIKEITLFDSRKAEVTIALKKNVKVASDSRAILRTRGFLGEAYVELIPGDPESSQLAAGDTIEYSSRTGDINTLVSKFNDIADDVKLITNNLKGVMGDDKNSPVNRIVDQLDSFTKSINDITLRNEGNIDKITTNMAAMTDQLREVISQGKANVQESMDRIASITRKIDEGKGTVGKLINDEETVDKLNEAVDGLNETMGGFRRLEAEVGFHTEYLTSQKGFKNYVSLNLKPTPDKAFMLDVVSDADPDPTHTKRTTDVTAGGTTTTVTTDTATVDKTKLRFSAQLAKKFYDFTLRGGIIENTGGFGLDYDKGPMSIQLSAYDFITEYGQKPHLKATGNVNVTKNFYVLGGVDDFIDGRVGNRSAFFGGGFRLVDDDIKSFVAGGGKSLMGK